MTASELGPIVLRLASIGATVTKAGKLRFRQSAVPPDERAAIASNLAVVTRALQATLALARTIEAEVAGQDAALRADIAREEREFEERKKRYRRDRLAAMDPAEVKAKALAGVLTEQDVAEWRAAREELLARRAELMGVVAGLSVFGRVVRVIQGSNGEMAVEVRRPGF